MKSSFRLLRRDLVDAQTSCCRRCHHSHYLSLVVGSIHRDITPSQFFCSGKLQAGSPPAAVMALFQIGEDYYGYKYSMTNKKTNSAPIYQCCRSTNWTDHKNCLWLYKSEDGHWIATKAPKTCDDPVNEGQPKFRTCEQVHDIEEGQWLEWSWFHAPTSQWMDNMGFRTYPLTTTMMSLGSDSGGSVLFLRGPEALAAVVEALDAPVSSEPAHTEPATDSQNEEQ